MSQSNTYCHISGETKIIAHIGYPTKTFTALKILNSCFNEMKANVIVVPFACKLGQLDHLLTGLIPIENFFGALITMPYKNSILPFLDHQSRLVTMAGSCNLVKFDGSRRMIGEMFDGEGFLNAANQKGVVLDGKSILLIGAGGVGSAIAVSLAFKGVAKLTIFDLDSEKSAQLCLRIRKYFPDIEVEVWNSKESGWNILVNASPLGMGSFDDLPVDFSHIKSADIVVDLVLSSNDTKFIKLARETGSETISGIDILYGQIPEMLKFFGFEKISVGRIKNLTKRWQN